MGPVMARMSSMRMAENSSAPTAWRAGAERDVKTPGRRPAARRRPAAPPLGGRERHAVRDRGGLLPSGAGLLHGRHGGAQGQQIAVHAKAADLALHDLGKHRDVAEGLARMDIVYV